MISGFQITLDEDVFDALKDAKKQRGQKFAQKFQRNTTRWAQFVLAELQEEPGKPKYPIRWKSQRQRRYVMAKLRREGNLPYKRTGRYVRAWGIRLDIKPTGGSLSIQNTSGIERYVQGVDQQPFHIDTGWKNSNDILRRAEEDLFNIAVNTWFEAVT